MLIVNADDWGRSRETTDRTLDCFHRGSVSSVSAMVFMDDSERAAALAQEHGIDAGLHVNFTTPFEGPHSTPTLLEHQRKLADFLLRNKIARLIYNPRLAVSFEYVMAAQREEFVRLYGSEPRRYDGHHHMHLCANVLRQNLLPHGSIVRPHFSHEARSKVARNWIFRRLTTPVLRRRYRIVDFFYSLPPLEPVGRLQNIFRRAEHSVVEVETHPVNQPEFHFLAEGAIFRWTQGCPIVSGFERALAS